MVTKTKFKTQVLHATDYNFLHIYYNGNDQTP